MFEEDDIAVNDNSLKELIIRQSSGKKGETELVGISVDEDNLQPGDIAKKDEPDPQKTVDDNTIDLSQSQDFSANIKRKKYGVNRIIEKNKTEFLENILKQHKDFTRTIDITKTQLGSKDAEQNQKIQ